VRIVTTHFNPFKHELLKRSYYKWISTLGPLQSRLKCYEIAFDDYYDIDESIKIKGTKNNLMWQKESLLNKALLETPDNIEFFVWLDHDVIFQDPDWLNKAINVLKSFEDIDAVQCLDHVALLDHNNTVINPMHWTPGYAWCSTTAYLKKQGGFSPYAIVGGGDALWLHIKLDELYQPMIDFKKIKKPKWSYLAIKAYHLYHGSLKNRMYGSRQKILEKHDYQKEDVKINEDGILEWNTDKSNMHKDIAEFFKLREG